MLRRRLPGHVRSIARRQPISLSAIRKAEVLSDEPGQLSSQGEGDVDPFEQAMAGEQGGAKPSGQPAAPLERRDQQNLTRWQFFSPAGPGEARGARKSHILPFLSIPPSNRPFQPLIGFALQIFADFMHNHTENNERALGARYNFSIKRIEAILRLKGMEKDWKKGIPLQTGFALGMEYLLGVKPDTEQEDPFRHLKRRTTPRDPDLTEAQLEELADMEAEEEEEYIIPDSLAADELEELEHRDAARQRYVRMPGVVVASLARAKTDAARHAKEALRLRSDRRLVPDVQTIGRLREKPEDKQFRLDTPGRIPITFVDVGAKVHGCARTRAPTERGREESLFVTLPRAEARAKTRPRASRLARMQERALKPFRDSTTYH
ncbi:hypothetical protein DL96DRAFT_1574994 [Flagelloscypha sp. PMI_526]|nr:hypothetical protein DL96DRAFT_1574994 [Flagelloscypha sp. PMI_526]